MSITSYGVWEVARGHNNDFLVEWYSDPAGTVLQDLTGAIILLEVRKREGGDLIFSLTNDDGISFKDGMIVGTPSPEKTLLLEKNSKAKVQIIAKLPSNPAPYRLWDGDVITTEVIAK